VVPKATRKLTVTIAIEEGFVLEATTTEVRN
jgi:hypothetical protein